MLSQLGDVLAGRFKDQAVCECRRCGLSVEPTTEVCPGCDCESIIRYEFE